MARARKPLLVPVKLSDGSILHDTDYCRGASSREEAEAINAPLRGQLDEYGHDKAVKFGAYYVMEELAPFTAEMRVVKYYHYKSSVYVELEDDHGRRWPMFLGDLVALLDGANMVDGWLPRARYEACKRSSAYGIREVES